MKLWHIGELNGGSVLQSEVTGQVDDRPSWESWFDYREPWGENILWTFPPDSLFSYPDFIEQLVMTGWDMDLSKLERPWWRLELDPAATIATVGGECDLRRLQRGFPCPESPCGEPRGHLDWPALAAEFDAFWLTYEGFLWGYKPGNWRYGCELCFFGGETVAVFNTAKVTSVTRL